MERDCLVAYGASNLLLERLMFSSDVCNPNVCSALVQQLMPAVAMNHWRTLMSFVSSCDKLWTPGCHMDYDTRNFYEVIGLD